MTYELCSAYAPKFLRIWTRIIIEQKFEARRLPGLSAQSRG
jgi:hypothetical protein